MYDEYPFHGSKNSVVDLTYGNAWYTDRDGIPDRYGKIRNNSIFRMSPDGILGDHRIYRFQLHR